MTIEVDAPTELIAQAAILGEAKKLSGSGSDSDSEHAHVHTANCANCGATLNGAYCHECGQSSHIHRSLWHMLEELLHGILHFETKSWRTLPMLAFYPGHLTRAYIDGKRTQYVSPLALFLFMIFTMFMVFSTTSSNLDSAKKPPSVAELKTKISNSRAEQVVLEAQRKTLKAGDETIADIDEDIKAAREEQVQLEKSLISAQIKEKEKQEEKLKNPAQEMKIEAPYYSEEDTKEWKSELQKHHFKSKIPWLDQAVRHAADNPDLIIYKLKGTVSKFAFVLVPISLPFLWLLFAFRRDVVIFDHAVFALYSLSFMALQLSLLALLALTGSAEFCAVIFILATPVHMFLQFKHTYGLSNRATLWRTILMLFMALIALTFFTLFVIIMALK